MSLRDAMFSSPLSLDAEPSSDDRSRLGLSQVDDSVFGVACTGLDRTTMDERDETGHYGDGGPATGGRRYLSSAHENVPRRFDGVARTMARARRGEPGHSNAGGH